MRHLFSTLLISAAVLLTGRPAFPQSPTADPKEMARSAGEEGLTLYREGKFSAAYERFAMAEQIAHSPVFLLWMARSKRGSRELLAARRLFERVAGEELAAGASPKWVTARSEAAAELAALVPKIPRIKLTLVAAPAGTTLELDGAAVEAGEIEVDPGSHTARASAPGRSPVSKKVEVEEGSTTIELRFASDATEPAQGSLVPGAVVLGAGLLALAGGAVTGAYALVLAGEVNEGCDGNVCLASDAHKAADADTLARASTGLFIAGGVVAATGVVLLIVRPRLGSDGGTALQVGPTGARLLWRF
ncbi:MAG: hypothetical protein JNK04_02885 [Myxococcales bacterium]|nr:hypothetical protein [Myxococcales bacterium]